MIGRAALPGLLGLLLLVSGCDLLGSPQAKTSPTPTAAPSPSPNPTPTLAPSPTPLASPTPAGTLAPVLVVNFVQVDYGFVSVRTNQPGAACTMSGTYPDGRPIAGLGAKATDGNGNATWTYGTNPADPQGTGTYRVSCTWNGLTDSSTANWLTNA